MVRLVHEYASGQWESMPLAIGLFVSVSVLVALCAKHTRRAPQKEFEGKTGDSKFAPKSPLVKPKQLVTNISNKAIPFISKKRGGDERGAEFGDQDQEGGFGEDGVWQKAILMGEKCQPPEFSGVILYDNYGNRLSEPPPRSPRASPLASFKSQMVRDMK